jgi:hypothetical protein
VKLNPGRWHLLDDIDGSILTLVEELDHILCLIQDIFLFVENQWLANAISQCKKQFPISRKFDALQQADFSHQENASLWMECGPNPCPAS